VLPVSQNETGSFFFDAFYSVFVDRGLLFANIYLEFFVHVLRRGVA
jgi:hypothetical protein